MMRCSIRLSGTALATCLLITCLSGCASDGVRAKQQAKVPDYDCSVEMQTPVGKISATRTLSSKGHQLVINAKWDAGDGTFANPWITAFWVAGGTSEIDFDQGTVDIMWHLWKSKGGRPASQRLRLELQARDAQSNDLGAPLRGGASETSGGPFHFDGRWSDVSMLAASSPQLELVARNDRGEFMYQTSVAPKIFSGVLSKVQEALRETSTMSRDVVHRCEIHGNDDIVVT